MTETKLLPCPHCGSINVGLPFDDRECAWVTCRNCECDGPLVKGGFDNAKAIEGWNRRATTPPTPASGRALTGGESVEGADTASKE
jgi:Lar family restriction alleviation protein